ncbi:MAG: glycosyltransferase [Acidobacteria bacterium]|jgi:hyaluronan synthase|nr:glycosyltransferase [Acidobacteriota bacterium]
MNVSSLGANAQPGMRMAVIKRKNFFSWDTLEPLIKLGVITAALFILGTALERDILFNWDFHHFLKMKSPFFKYMFMLNSFVFISAVIFRTLLWFKYRPYDSAQVTSWPAITVLVPAYNEGETVYDTIHSIASCDYPRGKLKIIAVDDGSQDDTYSYMLKAKKHFPRMVELIHFDKNRGKRHGIYQGFINSQSDYFVTVDSDTRLESDAIKELLTPLLINPQLGAVTGKIKIWNSNANIYTKMLKANFAMAFDFTRAIQSTFSTVFCTSGAFSAYRSAIVRKVIDDWMNQEFLGRKCTYGEDRSLANHILRTGHGTAFQRTAIAFTKVPEKFFKVLKMLTRWARSNIRESIIFSRLMFNRNRKGNYILPFFEFFSTIAIVFMHIIMFYFFLFAGFVDGNFIFRTIAYTILSGFFYMLYYIRIEGTKDFPYVLVFSIFSSIFMVWIFTTAGFTITRKSWSTR